jgi:hypothetical protein
VEKYLELFCGKKPIVILIEDGADTPEIAPSAVRAAIGVAAFAGLRQGEIGGNGGKTTTGIFSISDARCGGLTFSP